MKVVLVWKLLKNAGVALKQTKRLTRGKSLYFKTIKVALRAIVFTYSTSYAAPLPSSSLICITSPLCAWPIKSDRAECLLRWRTSDGKFIPPDTFYSHCRAIWTYGCHWRMGHAHGIKLASFNE